MNPIARRMAISLLAALLPSAFLFAQAPSNRSIAITVDDLPAVSSGYMSAQDVLTLTAKLVGLLHDQRSMSAKGLARSNAGPLRVAGTSRTARKCRSGCWRAATS